MTEPGGPSGFIGSSDISVSRTDLFLPVDTKHSAWLVSASIFALISLADLLLNLLRQRPRTGDDLESLAAVEIATIPHPGHRGERTEDDSESLAASEIATLPHPGHRSKTMDPGAHTDPSMGIRRRIRLSGGKRQEVQDGEEGFPYSVARYLNQDGEEGLPFSLARYFIPPGKQGTIGELQYFS